MFINQKRYLFGDDFTLSRLYVDNVIFASGPYILEDVVREVPGKPTKDWKIPRETAIPAGKYKVVIDMSQRFGKRMMHLLDVPGFDGIRVHAGNTSHDTEGCLITGKERDEKHGEVSGSRIACAALFDKVDKSLNKGDDVWWVVEGLPTKGDV